MDNSHEKQSYDKYERTRQEKRVLILTVTLDNKKIELETN